MTSLIIQGNFKGIGFDVMGLDPLRDNNLNRHKALFKDTDIVNIENLTHLEQCGDEFFGTNLLHHFLYTQSQIHPHHSEQ